jgi:hypothetical protein
MVWLLALENEDELERFKKLAGYSRQPRISEIFASGSTSYRECARFYGSTKRTFTCTTQ